MPKVSSVDDTDSDEEEEKDPGRDISKLKQKLKVKKKTKKRDRVLSREVKSKTRKYDKEEKEEELMAKAFVDPVRLLRDPQQFSEKLFAKLQKTSERFEVRVLFLTVIARVVADHQIVMLPLYPFLERYMEPTQLHATQLLALSAACVHSMIPPDVVEPLVKSIAQRFVNDRSEPDSITIGINSIREICKRQPLAMNAPLLSDLVEYKGQRGDKGVVMAARALIQLYRDVYPELLPAKYQGSSASALARQAVRRATDPANGTTTDSSNRPIFGAPKPLASIPGMELLLEYYQKKNEEAKTELSSSSDEEGSDDSEFEWVTDSEEGLGDDFETDSEGSIMEESDEDDDVDEDDEANVLNTRKAGSKVVVRKRKAQNDDEPPLLVPVAGNTSSAPAKKDKKKATAPVEESDDVADDTESFDEEDDEEDFDFEEFEEGDFDDEESEEEEVDQKPGQKRPRSSAALAAALEAEDSESDEEDDFDEEDDSDEEEEEAEATETTKKASATTSKLVPVTSTPKHLRASSAAPSDASANAPHWLKEDIRGNSSTSTQATNATTTLSKIVRDRMRNEHNMSDAASVATTTGTNLASVTLFSDEDFERLRKLRQHSAWDGMRNKDRDERLKKKEKLVHGVSTDLNASDLEQFTEGKRTADKEDKIAKTIEMRANKQSFNAGKKKKSKLNATHAEHSKRGKLFQMTKYSRRVGQKLKSSHEDKNARDKENKKSSVKFRINRGWKA